MTRSDEKVQITIRRTLLKKRKRLVKYDINKDYELCTYEVPDNIVIRNIEKYIKLIEQFDYRFLFGSKYSINNMLSLPAFNNLLESFIKQYLIGNAEYDFAKYAAGIEEFEIVTAGDSRPLAMATLLFQNNGEDIIRQLAGHVHVQTSAHYYTNISETIRASSIMQLQNRISARNRNASDNYNKGLFSVIEADKSKCMSWKMSIDERDLSDCINQDHLFECMGCDFFRPTMEELENFLSEQEKLADESAKRVLDYLNGILNYKNCDMTIDELFLHAQTEGSRYRMGCEVFAKEKAEEWQKSRHTQKIYC